MERWNAEAHAPSFHHFIFPSFAVRSYFRSTFFTAYFVTITPCVPRGRTG